VDFRRDEAGGEVGDAGSHREVEAVVLVEEEQAGEVAGDEAFVEEEDGGDSSCCSLLGERQTDAVASQLAYWSHLFTFILIHVTTTVAYILVSTL